jgi:hypothetical protein
MKLSINKNGKQDFDVIDKDLFTKDGILYVLSSDIAWIVLTLINKHRKSKEKVTAVIPDLWLNPVDCKDPVTDAC